MAYMAAHDRTKPSMLMADTRSVVMARMDYLPATTPADWQAVERTNLTNPNTAVVSVYARARDYHKVLRGRLRQLGEQINRAIGPLKYRVVCDSAPLPEAELAGRSGLGWRGKNTLLVSRHAGSMFFLGGILLDVALPEGAPASHHCGSCHACITACPTRAIVAPYQVDARRCISYLTIEHSGPIARELRPLMGNRIYGCDDCQLGCPWNKFAVRSALADFDLRPGRVGSQLVSLFDWTADAFDHNTRGSPIRRIGHERWLRNIAVALGNALRTAPSPGAVMAETAALQRHAGHPSALVREHVAWALAQRLW